MDGTLSPEGDLFISSWLGVGSLLFLLLFFPYRYCTPLHYAASVQGNAALVALLLLHGADATLQDSEGVTPAEYATATGDQEMILLLLNSHKRVKVLRRASWSADKQEREYAGNSMDEQRAHSAPGSSRAAASGLNGAGGSHASEWVQCWDEKTGCVRVPECACVRA